jgi:hypothetical protein
MREDFSHPPQMIADIAQRALTVLLTQHHAMCSQIIKKLQSRAGTITLNADDVGFVMHNFAAWSEDRSKLMQIIELLQSISFSYSLSPAQIDELLEDIVERFNKFALERTYEKS